MISTIGAKLKQCTLHIVGNKLREEGVSISKSLQIIEKEHENHLLHYFFSSFKYDELYQLTHESDLTYNEVFGYVTEIFNNPERLHEQAARLAKHLYNQSSHPKIKKGEFYVAYFRNCVVDGACVDAVGLFKSENKDTFLKINPSGETFEIESQQGVNINKLDKGCLIFNTRKFEGYTVAIVDNINKGMEAKYWADDFLHVKLQQNDFSLTQNVLSLFQDFVTQQMPAEQNVSKADQAALLNKGIRTMKRNETMELNQFAREIFGDTEMAQRFDQFKKEFEKKRDVEFEDSFQISDTALKKKAMGTLQTIKLDKNFDIRIHGGEQYIERGYDEVRGMYYYRLFFKEEK
ncbi:MAG: nucleoid-associated protein [Bacteroidales bacterium]